MKLVFRGLSLLCGDPERETAGLLGIGDTQRDKVQDLGNFTGSLSGPQPQVVTAP